MILALDQGTTSSRAIVFDPNLRPVRTAQREFPQRYPQSGWVEHDPEAIWGSQISAAQEVLGDDCEAIGLTNQRETTLLWDRRTGIPVHPAIVWQDRRTAPRCDELREEGRAQWIRAKTGLELDAYFSATKLEWLLRNVPGARPAAEAGHLAFGTVDSYLIWRLTSGDVHATDVTNASRTMLWNLREARWDSELLKLFGIPPGVLPRVQESRSHFGDTDPKVLGRRLPILGVAGDQQAAAFGQGCTTPGSVKCTYGTGCFLLLATGPTAVHSRHRLLTATTCVPGEFALEGSVFVAGAAIQWLRDGLGMISQASECDGLALSVPDTDGVAFVPAFVGLGAPFWDSSARGAFLGLSRGTTKAHMVRAVLESIAYQVEDLLTAASADSGLSIPELRVDGGLAASDFLMQFQADLSGRRVVRPAMLESTAKGAALLAGLGLGRWKSPAEALQDAEDTVFEPQMQEEERASRREVWAKAVEKSRGWV